MAYDESGLLFLQLIIFILFPALKTTAVNCLSFSAMSTFRNLFHKKCGRKYNLCSVVRILWQVCGLHTVTNRRFVIKAKKVKIWTVEVTEHAGLDNDGLWTRRR